MPVATFTRQISLFHLFTLRLSLSIALLLVLLLSMANLWSILLDIDWASKHVLSRIVVQCRKERADFRKLRRLRLSFPTPTKLQANSKIVQRHITWRVVYRELGIGQPASR